MTYNVFSGTLNPTHSLAQKSDSTQAKVENQTQPDPA